MITVPNIPGIIERWLREQDASGGWRRDRLHASDLGVMIPGEGCQRQVWLRVRGAEGRLATPGELLMFRKANAIHEMMSGLLKERLPLDNPGWVVEAIEEADAEHYGEARLDVLLKHVSTGERWILDFKSKRGRAFEMGKVFTRRAEWQVRDYARRWDTRGAILLATDREGSNFCRQMVVERDDHGVGALWEQLYAMARSPEPPPVELPKVSKHETKTKGIAVKVDLPWTCSYCMFRGISCPGALSDDRRGRVAGHIDGDGGFKLAKDVPEAVGVATLAALARADKLGLEGEG